MTHRTYFFFAALGLAWACSGKASVDGSGASSTSTSSSPNTTTGSMMSSSVGVSVGGAGGGSSECDGLAEAACMAAYPNCAPTYDDACCPNCYKGGCADCSDYEFYLCTPLATACTGDTCWNAPPFACNGGVPPCPALTDPRDTYACDQAPGCVVAECAGSGCTRECHPVTAGSCSVKCDAVPPTCPPGLVAEADGFCFTGFCIPGAVCGL